MLPDKQPTTIQEAESICRELDWLVAPTPPAETKILSYIEADPITPRNVFPMFPCEGLPLPRMTKLTWPEEVRTQIRILKGKKTIKYMLARLLPVRIPQVDVYVFSARMTGVYTGQVENVGEVLLASGNLVKWLQVKTYQIINAIRSGSPPVQEGRAVDINISFEYKGWKAIQELWNYMWSRSIEAQMKADIRVEGYETADYEVAPYEKTFTVSAILPVDRMKWHAWG